MLPATALAALVALSLGAYAGYAAGQRPRPTFKLTAAPVQNTIAAGSTAGYRLRIHRRQFPWAIRLTVARPLPTGVAVHFSPHARTRRSRLTLTVATRAWTLPGVYHLTVRAKHGRMLRRITLTLTVGGSTTSSDTTAVAIPDFSVAGNAGGPLEPGVPQGIDLRMTNPYHVPVVVSSLSASLRSVSAPNATPSLPCTLADFALASYSGPLPLTVPAGSTRSLDQLGVSPTQWPQVSIINRPTDQDGCQGATVTFVYSWVVTPG